MIRPITTFGKYLMLMGRVFGRPERFRMYFKQYVNEMYQLGINSIGIVLLISFFIGAVICIQIKLNIESPWMPRFVVGYTTRGAFCTAWFGGIMNATDLEYGLQYCFIEWYIWCSFIKSLFFAFIIASVSAYFGYTVEGGSISVGKASTNSVVSSSVLILFSDLILTQLLMG